MITQINNRLPLSDNLYLVHSSSIGEGKTRAMAKGLMLCYGNSVFAGESAGFGLPVIKINNTTVFPSLISSHMICPGCVQAVYHLNLLNTWRIFGLSAPPYYSCVMERIVMWFMKKPQIQQSGLVIRNTLFRLFQIRSLMRPGKSFGYCRVSYKTMHNRLEICIDGQGLNSGGELVLLNEVSGIDFCRMTTGQFIREGNDFLPWQNCPMDTRIENIDRGLGFSISIPENIVYTGFQLAAGREIARDLNWAGLVLSTNLSAFTYYVNFYIKKSE